jgi:hypothetical protein
MQLFERLWKPKRIETAQALAEHLAQAADSLTKGTLIQYVQAAVGVFWEKLVSEQEFRDAMERARWTAYPAILADMVLVCESLFRPHSNATDEQRLAAFSDLLGKALAVRPLPAAHAGVGAPILGQFAGELGRSLIAAPRPPDQIARNSGSHLYRCLPIHSSLRRQHEEPVVNAVRFRMVGFRDELARLVADPAALLMLLLRDAADAQTAGRDGQA